ncbi:hypothetical protein BGZ83_008314 [Gryganskiella cystojenkinii]|nr:hypothetical protein BGZ83_008314 [Gryganskiella cystojenkinii]
MRTILSSAISTLLATALIATLVIDTATATGKLLTQAQAEALLKPNGITASSTGGCTNRHSPSCTSYDGILSGTVNGIIALKKASGVSSLVITGGTEVGHKDEDGMHSRSEGHKVDIRRSPVLDTYIRNKFTYLGHRSGGFAEWGAASGDIYADELSHWGITYP